MRKPESMLVLFVVLLGVGYVALTWLSGQKGLPSAAVGPDSAGKPLSAQANPSDPRMAAILKVLAPWDGASVGTEAVYGSSPVRPSGPAAGGAHGPPPPSGYLPPVGSSPGPAGELTTRRRVLEVGLDGLLIEEALQREGAWVPTTRVLLPHYAGLTHAAQLTIRTASPSVVVLGGVDVACEGVILLRERNGQVLGQVDACYSSDNGVLRWKVSGDWMDPLDALYTLRQYEVLEVDVPCTVGTRELRCLRVKYLFTGKDQLERGEALWSQNVPGGFLKREYRAEKGKGSGDNVVRLVEFSVPGA